jgi:hypothetical protein
LIDLIWGEPVIKIASCGPQKPYPSEELHGVKQSADCATLLLMSRISRVLELMGGVLGVFIDALTFLRLILRSSSALAAENLFLRKQLGLYVERKKKPQRPTDRVRFTLAQFSSGEMPLQSSSPTR